MVDDETLAQFAAIIGTTPDRGRQYLNLTDGDVEQAIELFFANGGAALGDSNTSDTTSPFHRPPVSQPPTRPLDQVQTIDDGIIHIDSDSEPDNSDDDIVAGHRPQAQAPRPGRPASSLNTLAGVTPPSGREPGSTDDDEAIARRLQEEMYGEPGVVPEMDPQGIRAPIARTTETLIGPDSFDPNDPEDMNAAVQQQIRARDTRRTRGRPGIFNQDGFNSIWNDESSALDSHRERLSRATAGASETSSKSRSLAEMYRPPYEIMSRLPWDQARQQGKESEKWILVNIQDPSIFDCQILNRDIWKDPGVVETVKENFIFMQYTKDDPRSNQYVQYYFAAHENQDAYPHIAIVDPRTGEQVKVWSGPSAPKAADFLMQLHEFLDRYSLKAAAKNPVAKRKPEVKKATQVNEMTEDQMLEMALQNSLAGQNPSQEPDPDDLTRSIVFEGDGKEKELSENADLTEADSVHANGFANPRSLFMSISASHPHTEPPSDASSTRIQFRHPNGRIVRRFLLADPVRRIYEWLKASPIEGKNGVAFELVFMQKNLISFLDDTIEQAGLKNGTVMVEFVEA